MYVYFGMSSLHSMLLIFFRTWNTVYTEAYINRHLICNNRVLSQKQTIVQMS